MSLKLMALTLDMTYKAMEPKRYPRSKFVVDLFGVQVEVSCEIYRLQPGESGHDPRNPRDFIIDDVQPECFDCRETRAQIAAQVNPK